MGRRQRLHPPHIETIASRCLQAGEQFHHQGLGLTREALHLEIERAGHLPPPAGHRQPEQEEPTPVADDAQAAAQESHETLKPRPRSPRETAGPPEERPDSNQPRNTPVRTTTHHLVSPLAVLHTACAVSCQTCSWTSPEVRSKMVNSSLLCSVFSLWLAVPEDADRVTTEPPAANPTPAQQSRALFASAEDRGERLPNRLQFLERKPKKPASQDDDKLLEQHIVRVRSHPSRLETIEGDTVFFELELDFAHTDSGFEAGLTSRGKAPGIQWIPWVHIVDARRDGPRTQATLRVALRAGIARRAPYRLSATLAVYTKDGSKTLWRKDVQVELRVWPHETTSKALALDRRAFLFFQKRAKTVYEKLQDHRHRLSLSEMTRPPPARSVPEEKWPSVVQFFEHRVRAETAYHRLRKAADSRDPTLARQAIMALAALADEAPGPNGPRFSNQKHLKPQQTLKSAKRALQDLRFRKAETLLQSAKLSGQLNRTEFAQTFQLLALLYAAKNQQHQAEKHLGQALSAAPTLKNPFLRRFFRHWIETTKAKLRTQKPIEIRKVRAQRFRSHEGPKLLVSAEFGPDPWSLIAGGDIEVWSGGGQVESVKQIRAQNGSLSATFSDSAQVRNYAGDLLVKVLVKEISGTVIAGFGEPSPIAIAVEEAEALDTTWSIPWWAWLAASGAAIAGAATLGIVLADGNDVERGIGPVTVSF